MVKLHEVLSRCGGWDSVKEWQDVLSGGEKQKLAMARLFFNKPKCMPMPPRINLEFQHVARVRYPGRVHERSRFG